jgi:transcriptional regulator with XRE-family HTH domain
LTPLGNPFTLSLGKLSEAIKTLRESLGVTQLEIAVKLDVGGHAVAHYESGRKPDAVVAARLCGVAHQAGRDDLADVFAAALPGVAEGLLIPVWRLPEGQQPTFEARRPETPVVDRFDNKPARSSFTLMDQRAKSYTLQKKQRRTSRSFTPPSS